MKRYRVIEEQPAPHRLVVEPMISALNARDAVARYAARWQIKGRLRCIVLSDGHEPVERVEMHCSPQRRKPRRYR